MVDHTEYDYPQFAELYRCLEPVDIVGYPPTPVAEVESFTDAEGPMSTHSSSSDPNDIPANSEGGPLDTGEADEFMQPPSLPEVKQMLHTCKVLVVGAGGLGCELLKDLALSGFRDIHVIDMDTIDVSNLNRQFLFRAKDIGQPKANVAAAFVNSRVATAQVTPHHCRIQDKDKAFYLQFQVIICGLDSVEARRWMNAFLVGIADMQNPETLKPLIDGGTEDLALDTDNPDHLRWVFERALERAESFRIPGVTYTLTQGVVKNIIPAIASTNAVIAAACANEALKLVTNCHPYLDNYMMYTGTAGIYTYTYAHAKRSDCPVCGSARCCVTFDPRRPLRDLVEWLAEEPGIRLVAPSLVTTAQVNLYLQAPPQLEVQTRPNLDKSLGSLIRDDEEIMVTDRTLPVSLILRVKLLGED
ncbi:NEDD8 activating enzyme [Tieghemiomyces parasiticus]|uniref:NEDD8-activating enzyme E1 catalytic subunit n=1 Tax=Tieghemiomyces parasiticus TaxID=78921 RepID=A0A9W7ZVA1_9FUNG|nr:NEDD8 activating enzyme [Tieghemiomyces parasiticus]